MSNQNKTGKSKGKTSAKQTDNKRNLPIILTAVIVVCVTVVTVAVSNGSNNGKAASDVMQVITKDDVLSIPTADISQTASFYPIEVDGTEMEVLAVQASDGTIRTAFNTCQSCYASGRGYYVLEGEELVCQNCGFHFSPDQVEVQSGGCNPWPIFAENKAVMADSIDISYDFLKSSSAIFANWK